MSTCKQCLGLEIHLVFEWMSGDPVWSAGHWPLRVLRVSTSSSHVSPGSCVLACLRAVRAGISEVTQARSRRLQWGQPRPPRLQRAVYAPSLPSESQSVLCTCRVFSIGFTSSRVSFHSRCAEGTIVLCSTKKVKASSPLFRQPPFGQQAGAPNFWWLFKRMKPLPLPSQAALLPLVLAEYRLLSKEGNLASVWWWLPRKPFRTPDWA